MKKIFFLIPKSFFFVIAFLNLLHDDILIFGQESMDRKMTKSFLLRNASGGPLLKKFHKTFWIPDSTDKSNKYTTCFCLDNGVHFFDSESSVQT